MGHFLVARWNGVRVDVFSIGFGPELVGFNDRHGTRWKVSALPLGGFVKFFGDGDASSATAEEAELTDDEKKVAFHYKSVWQRIAIVFAGPAANLIFAIVVFAIIYAAFGQMATPPVIADVLPDSAAAEAGLEPGDRILAVDGHEIQRFEELQHLVPLSNGAALELSVQRDGQTLTLMATPHIQEVTDSLGETRKQAVLGISASSSEDDLVRLGPVDAVVAAFTQAYSLTEATVISVGQMIAGERGTEDLGGPLRIAEMSGQVAELGFVSLLLFTAFLSVNLGLINLLPIPVLDGGHLLFYGIEAVRGRPLNEQAQEYGFRVGLAIIVALMVFVTWNDIVREVHQFLEG
ncbi:RIP metalloprotease RseP [Roseospira marina]|uniref:Zinc metalloprotease n=2 Tax=Roseospira marina TaxID=140057 RepID=A0A5M6I8Q1_9PROT|nr:RIP metalloprotease RseP [Roseospira marina]